MKHLQTFFTSIAWWTLLPDKDLLTQQPSGDDSARYISAARSENRDLAVVYMPVGGKLELKKGVLRNGLQAEWFNPRN
jgi:hypothetical protein